MAYDEIIQRLRRFHLKHFPRFRRRFEGLIESGQRLTVPFIGFSGSRVVPDLLTVNVAACI